MGGTFYPLLTMEPFYPLLTKEGMGEVIFNTGGFTFYSSTALLFCCSINPHPVAEKIQWLHRLFIKNLYFSISLRRRHNGHVYCFLHLQIIRNWIPHSRNIGTELHFMEMIS
ncbi:MAG: hypothetical protein COW90_04355 [Nitrospirae bacterium CG22_combo_CG10-13_8_21_14_all_44_11]|nr:MAG: hypothetical protein COW90_04355 [Nitrospirae bacterium CG22_combo_CG10-13_8_21_14_all_44_11]